MAPPSARKSTRDRILDAARELFWEKGYGSTSIADILQRSGTNSGSLYHAFPAKQDVLIAVLEVYRDGIGPMLLEPAWQGVDDPIERIFSLLDRYRVGLITTGLSYSCPIGSIALELHEPDPAVRKGLVDNFHGWVAAIEECLRQARGRLPRRINRRALATFVLTTMEGGVMLARTDRSIKPFNESVAMLRDYFDRLLSSPARQEAR
jgi:TetR/AcrR family transcriptional regulator, transcriptional repressor for nem operon